MKAKTAEELMAPLESFPSVSKDATLAEALEKIYQNGDKDSDQNHKARSVIVFDGEDFIGILRRRDILNAIEPAEIVTKKKKKAPSIDLDEDLSDANLEKVIKKLIDRTEVSIKDFIIKPKVFVNWDDHIVKIIYMLAKATKSILPVKKKDKIIGIIRSSELIDEIADLVAVPEHVE